MLLVGIFLLSAHHLYLLRFTGALYAYCISLLKIYYTYFSNLGIQSPSCDLMKNSILHCLVRSRSLQNRGLRFQGCLLSFKVPQNYVFLATAYVNCISLQNSDQNNLCCRYNVAIKCATITPGTVAEIIIRDHSLLVLFS